MMRKFLWPVVALACLLLVAELLNLSAVRPFGAILSIVGMAFCVLARMSARSKADRPRGTFDVLAVCLCAGYLDFPDVLAIKREKRPPKGGLFVAI